MLKIKTPFEKRTHFNLANKFTAPWLEDKKLNWTSSELYKKVYFTLKQFAKHAMTVEGDVVEFGVFQGNSAAYIQDIIPDDKKFYLFDTFQGLPKAGKNDIYWEAGDFDNTSVELIKNKLKRANISIQKGDIKETLKNCQIQKLCFAHIDVDLYESTKKALEFAYPIMTKGGIIVFDDYGDLVSRGAKKAIDEFFYKQEESLIYLTTKQAIIIKM